MRLNIVRKAVQTAVVALLLAVPLLNKAEVNFLQGTLYSFSIGPVWITDPLTGIQAVLTTGKFDFQLLLSLLIPVIFTLALGRVFCGWICPQNLLSEIADRVAEKAGIGRLFHGKPSPVPRLAILVLILFLIVLVGLPMVSLLSAPGIISAQISGIVTEGVAGAELALIGFILAVELFFLRRGWCNYVCPVGGFLGLLRIKRTMKVEFSRADGRSCAGCGECVRSCQLGLNPMGGKIYPLCHNCGDCIAACAAEKKQSKPLRFKF